MTETNTYQADKPAALMTMSVSQIVKVALLGAVTGLLAWGLTLLIDTYVLNVIVCQGSQISRCASTTQYAEVAAAILAGGVGLFGLVRLQVFRPLLVVIAVSVSLWGLVGMASALPWYSVAFASVVLYTAAYLLFSWIARIRMFWLVVLLLIVLTIVVRLVLTA